MIKWFIGVVVMGVAVNLLSGLIVTKEWAWLPPAVFGAALLIAVPELSLPDVMLNGVPVCTVTMPLIAQPPNALRISRC